MFRDRNIHYDIADKSQGPPLRRPRRLPPPGPATGPGRRHRRPPAPAQAPPPLLRVRPRPQPRLQPPGRRHVPQGPRTAPQRRDLPRRPRRPTHPRPDHRRRLLPPLRGRRHRHPDGRHQRQAAARSGSSSPTPSSSRPSSRSTAPGGDDRRVQAGHGHLLQRPAGATTRCWCRWPTPRSCCSWSTARATAPATRGPPPTSTAPPPCAARRLPPASCSAATPTSPRRPTWTAGTSDGIGFVFGIDALPNLVARAQRLPERVWQTLQRPPGYEVDDAARGSGPPTSRRRWCGGGASATSGWSASRWPSSTTGRGLPAGLPGRGAAQEPGREQKGEQVERGDALLLLHHQRVDVVARGGGVLRQRPLQPGEPDRAAEERGAGVAGAGEHAGVQLGVHGDDGVGLEPEGVAGVAAAADGGTGSGC